MSFVIQSTPLKDAIAKLSTIVDRKSSRPILTNIHFQFSTDILKLTATDLEVSTEIQIPIELKESGTFCLNAKNIADIVRELPDDYVLFTTRENNLELKCRDTVYSLLSSPADEYPKIQYNFSENSFSLPAQTLLTMLNKTSFAMSNDETRIFLNGIFLKAENEKIKAVAIDGHRLAKYEIDSTVKNNTSLGEGIIIPKKGIYELKKILSSLKENEKTKEVELAINQSHLFFKIENVVSSIRLIVRDYPKYQSVIPNKTQSKLMANREEIINAVKRIKIASSEQTNGIKFEIKDNILKLSAQSNHLGQGLETFKVISYEGDDIETRFNGKYLLDVLSVLDSENVIMEFTNSLNPTIIRYEEAPQFLSIIMPLRL